VKRSARALWLRKRSWNSLRNISPNNDSNAQCAWEGNRYFGQAPGNPKHELFPVSAAKYFIPEVESQITFVKDEKGENASAEGN
jgi:hypothetical protein